MSGRDDLQAPHAGSFAGWVPAEHLDSVAPEPRATPDDWLVRFWRDRRGRAGECVLDGFGERPPRPLADGERIVFCGLTTFPHVLVVWRGPGCWEALTPVPPAATGFATLDDDATTFAESLVEFATKLEQLRGPFAVGEEVQVDAYAWRDSAFVLRDGALVVDTSPETPAEQETDHA